LLGVGGCVGAGVVEGEAEEVIPPSTASPVGVTLGVK